MANDRPGDWRHPSAGKPTRHPAAPRPSRREWQPGGAEAAPARKGRSRRTRLIVAALATLGLVGITVWVISLLRPAKYPQLVVVGPPAAPVPAELLALPADAAAATTAAEFVRWAGEDRGTTLRLNPAAAVTAEDGNAKVVVDPEARNLVLYFTGSGGADAKRGAFVLATPDGGKLYVRDILDRAAARRGKPTLIVFDCTRVTASWPYGLIFNDFARALKALDGAIADIDGLAVVCASDEDQRSWVAEERQSSAFGYYLLEALKGAGHAPGARVTAATAFDHAKSEVEQWAVANRNEEQRPILLPAADGLGRKRAERIDLAAAPAGGYSSPPPGIQTHVPDDVEKVWAEADKIAKRVPEATAPAAWRQYLELLMRWENQLRLGADPATVRGEVDRLASQLSKPAAGRELPALAAAVPAARALGRPPAFTENEVADFARTFQAVWNAQGRAARIQAWAVLRTRADRDPAIRMAAADYVLDRLSGEKVTADALRVAAEVLETTHGDAGLPAPAEAHFVRLLQLHITTDRPDLLREAVEMRREAEKAAWVFLAPPGEYAYPEFVFPWVRGHVEAGDRNRQRGQDLLFSDDPKDAAEAQAYFARARTGTGTGYEQARKDGRAVAGALAARDRVFARLPYYVRWLAASRSRTVTDPDRLLTRAAAAFEAAHRIAKLTATDPPSASAERDKALAELDKLRDAADECYQEVKKAFDAEVAALNNNPQPPNWHALDAALAVPFIPARRRAELLGYLRHVSSQLEEKRQQPKGATVAPAAVREAAARHGRAALALLGETDPNFRRLLDQPDPGAWWQSYRAVGDRIEERFRAQAGEARTAASEAGRAAGLRPVGPLLAAAAVKARVADPAAPVAGDAVAADTRFRRHGLLLWHAHRVTDEGWADVIPTDPTDPNGWYCRKTSALLIESAEALIGETAAELTAGPGALNQAQRDRWLADCKAERDYHPVVLVTDPPGEIEITDDPFADYRYRLALPAKDKDRNGIGFPISRLAAPPAPFPQPAAGTTGRRVVTDFVGGRTEAVRELRLTSAGTPREARGKLTATTLYRGHQYETNTPVTLVGRPTRESVYNPPTGPASFAIGAGPADVAGAVTVLIDLSETMTRKREGNQTRLDEALKGLKQLLSDGVLPEGTTVHFAYFYGNEERTDLTVRPFGKPAILGRTPRQRAAVYDQLEQDYRTEFKGKEPPYGLSTPLAGAIAAVLRKDARAFWPEKLSGSRALIVLTDGEDNWGAFEDKSGKLHKNRYGEVEPGVVARDALMNTDDDVNLHIMFFGVESPAEKAEVKQAVKQFQPLSNRVNFIKPDRTAAVLWEDVKDANALADTVRRAMIPRYLYKAGQTETALEVTIRELSSEFRPTPGLEAGEYKIRNAPTAPPLRHEQAVQLRAADRVFVQTRRAKDGKIELYLPSYGFETAKALRRPRKAEGNAETSLDGTIPVFDVDHGIKNVNLSAAMTLESLGERRSANLLELTRPLFVWFDVARADGVPAEKGVRPGVRVENLWPVWAPTWKVQVDQWVQGRADPKDVPHPAFTGYWLDGWPQRAASFSVNLDDVPGSWERAKKVHTVRGAEVSLVGLGIERYAPPGQREGNYLTVRFRYAAPGEYVFLRPGNLKGVKQPTELYERHVYYDDAKRYTVRFGPILDTDPIRIVTLDLHAVADLKQTAKKVTVDVQAREGEALPSLKMPDELTRPPG